MITKEDFLEEAVKRALDKDTTECFTVSDLFTKDEWSKLKAKGILGIEFKKVIESSSWLRFKVLPKVEKEKQKYERL